MSCRGLIAVARKLPFMVTIVGLSGSLRTASYNAMLLRAAAELSPRDAAVDQASIRGIPLYDGDLEASDGIPAAVQELKNRIAAADGLLIVTPEYNNSIPGVLKNTIDWLSRPPADIQRVFGGRRVAIIGTTTGAAGTTLAQIAWLPVLRVLGTSPWFGGRLMMSSAATVFDAAGHMVDEAAKSRLEAFMKGFAAFVAER